MLLVALFSTYVSIILLSALFLSLFVTYYVYQVKPYSQFANFSFNLKLAQWLLKRRKDVTLPTYFFRELVEASKKYQNEGMFVLRLTRPIIFVYGEEITKMILNEPSAIDKAYFYKNLEFALGKGIFVSNGEDWKKLRKVVHPAIHGPSLKNKAQLMNEKAEELVHYFYETKGCPTNEVMNIVKISTCRMFSEATLGKEAEELKKDSDCRYLLNQLHRLMKFGTERVIYPWYQWDALLYFIPKAREMMQLTEELKHLIVHGIEKLKTSMLEQEADQKLNEPVPQNDILMKYQYFAQTLLKEHLKNPDFTMDDVYYQFLNLAIAGFETTASSIMWTLFMLGLHPEIQEQAYNEITSLTERDVKFEDLRNLEYLECIIKETLRIYPVGPFYGRYLNKEIQCGKIKIPKGSNIAIFIYMIHRDPNVYPDPEKFDPERFRDPAVLNKPWSHIPFAESVRPCVGKSYAMMQMKILLCHILRNFKVISLDRREDIDNHLSWEIVLTCTKYPRMKFIPR